jgi:hypothetical protein
LDEEQQNFTVNYTSCSVALIFKWHSVIMSLLKLQILKETIQIIQPTRCNSFTSLLLASQKVMGSIPDGVGIFSLT